MLKLTRFKNATLNTGNFEYLPVKAGEGVVDGEALVLSNGTLTKCNATTKPTFIAMASKAAEDIERVIAVIRTNPEQEFEVPLRFAGDMPTLTIGSKVTIDTDALGVTATTTNGVVTILDLKNATESGDKIRVAII